MMETAEDGQSHKKIYPANIGRKSKTTKERNSRTPNCSGSSAGAATKGQAEEEENWNKVQEWIANLVQFHFTVVIVTEHMGLLDVTHEHTRIDGKSVRQYHFLYTLTGLMVVNASYPSPRFRGLVNSIFGSHASPKLLFLAILVFSAIVSAAALVIFRYFYTNVFYIYDISDTWIWCYIVNRFLFLFTLLLSRAIPPALAHIWFAWSVAWQVLFHVARYFLALLNTVLAVATKEIPIHISPLLQSLAAYSNGLAVFCLLIFTIVLARNTAPIKMVSAALLGLLSRIWGFFLLGILYFFRQFPVKCFDKLMEKLATAVYAKFEGKILRRESQFLENQERRPVRIYLVDKEVQAGPGLLEFNEAETTHESSN